VGGTKREVASKTGPEETADADDLRGAHDRESKKKACPGFTTNDDKHTRTKLS